MNTKRNNNGFSLIEIMITMTILSAVVSTTYMLLASAQDTYSQGTKLSDVRNQVRQITKEISDELRQASVATITIVDTNAEGDQEISFQKNTGYDGNNIVLGPVITFSSDMMNGEVNNGLDDNNNGLVDERKITRNENGDTVNINSWIREGSMKFTQNLSSIRFEVDLEISDIEQDALLQASGDVTVDIRNP